MTQSRAPLIVVFALLLVPVLYVGSYCALVVPSGTKIATKVRGVREYHYYRMGGYQADVFFSPLEELDRKLRPDAWQPPWPEMEKYYYRSWGKWVEKPDGQDHIP